MIEKRAKLLVVEDHGPLRAAVVSVLENLDYEVVAIANGTEGLDKTREVKPDLAFRVVSNLKSRGIRSAETLLTAGTGVQSGVVLVLCERVHSSHALA
jgi:CheY-like chemotaxis protein